MFCSIIARMSGGARVVNWAKVASRSMLATTAHRMNSNSASNPVAASRNQPLRPNCRRMISIIAPPLLVITEEDVFQLRLGKDQIIDICTGQCAQHGVDVAANPQR